MARHSASVMGFVLLVVLSLLYLCFNRFSPVLGGLQVGREHLLGEEVYAMVGSLTSPYTLLPFSYYGLPYCRPPGGIKTPAEAENLWEMLMRQGKHNSPYRFRIGVNESLYLCATDPLTGPEVELLKERTDDIYSVNMFLDGLPLMRRIEWHGDLLGRQLGFPVGYNRPGLASAHSIVNHLKFLVLLHESMGSRAEGSRTGEAGAGKGESSGYKVVGVEVIGCSVMWPTGSLLEHNMFDRIPPVECQPETAASRLIREGDRVEFTYEVEFLKSNFSRSARQDGDLKSIYEPYDTIHQSSILNSLITIIVLTAFLFFKFLRRTEVRDWTRHVQLDVESHLTTLVLCGEVERQKLVAGDIFGPPCCMKLLCALTGNGAQIVCVAIVLTSSAALGVISVPSQSLLLTWTLILYLIFGLVAGYVSVWLWTNIRGGFEGWRSVCWWLSCFFSGIVFLILSAVDFIYWQEGSTGFATISSFLRLLGLWSCILVPLTYLGGMLSARSELMQCPLIANKFNRQILKRNNWSSVCVFLWGTLPFSTILVEFFYVLHSIRFGMSYDTYRFLVVALILLVIVCAEVSVIVTCKSLQRDDWHWWWKAFLAPGSSGLYMFLYLIMKLQRLSSGASVLIYIGYSVIAASATALFTGAIGVLVALFFIHCVSIRKI
uniref:Transmembrane 9 superfamily member n=1 Tax=Anthurium amnicola TaxID=1678845 RepID=A0A1D1Z4I1_9ARAE